MHTHPTPPHPTPPHPSLPLPGAPPSLPPSLPQDHKMKLAISYALAQSTKLSVYEKRVTDIVLETKHLPEALAEHGAVEISGHDIAKLIGKVGGPAWIGRAGGRARVVGWLGGCGGLAQMCYGVF